MVECAILITIREAARQVSLGAFQDVETLVMTVICTILIQVVCTAFLISGLFFLLRLEALFARRIRVNIEASILMARGAIIIEVVNISSSIPYRANLRVCALYAM